MPKKREDWTMGRTRHVRVYLTEDEHALLRIAAAKVDRSLARFSVEAIVEAAKKLASEEDKPKKGGRK
jgi:uncharacterized protein (DUF1778 family)